MRLTARLVVLLTLLLSGLLLADGFLEYRRERELLRDDMRRDAEVLGIALGRMLEAAWERTGAERGIELLDDAGLDDGEVQARLVWLDAPPGSVDGPTVAAPPLGGEDAFEVEGRLLSYVPIRSSSRRPAALELSQSLTLLSSRSARVLARSSILLLGLFVIAAGTIVLVGLLFVGRPLARLKAQAERIGTGDLSGRVHLPGRSELSDLAATMNTMSERLVESRENLAKETAARIEAIEQARHADRLRTVGRLAAGVAHELGTPLSVVAGRAALISNGDLDPSTVRESCEIVRRQADRMTEIVRKLLSFARRGSALREPNDPVDIARHCMAMVQSSAQKRGVAIRLAEPTGAPPLVACNRPEIEQVFTNLLLNAIQASDSGGEVTITIDAEVARPPQPPDAPARPTVRVTVRDRGSGIAAADLPRIFEPFFTTKDVGEGTGLGLSIVHGIVEEHRGWITVETRPGQGCSFSVFLLAEATT